MTLAGSGSLWLLRSSASQLELLSRQRWPDVLVDVVWSAADPTILSTVSGDGSVAVWKIQGRI
jgi:hypothetical protein